MSGQTMRSPVLSFAGAPAPSMRRHLYAALLIGVATTAFAVAGGRIELAGAVIAPGQLVVESDVKKVQHPTGGVVGELLVENGTRVRAGDVLIRLDATQTRANLDMVTRTLDELAARTARDEAERDGARSVDFSKDLIERSRHDAVTGKLLAGETRLFNAKVSSRDGQRAQLRERIAQLRQEVSGLTEQSAAKEGELALIATELKGVRELYAKNLISISRVTGLERDATRLRGERGQLIATTAATRGKIAETELQILQVDGDMRTETGRDLAEARARWSEYVERRVAAEDQLKRIEMRSPADGVVHQLAIHTVGGVVAPNEPVMLIVPDSEKLEVEVHIQPQDIDGVRTGQVATLRFTAFNARTTPEVEGEMTRISADVTSDPKTGQNYYMARIALTPEQENRLGGVRLVPGMPVEAHVRTPERTVLSYLTKPLTDQLSKAWRER